MNLARLAFITAALAPVSFPTASAATAPAAADPSAGSTLTTLRIKAEQGDANAQYDLGVAYAQGRQTPRDLVEAFAWLTLAAERGVDGGALENVVDNLQPAALTQVRRRLEALRAAYPNLRAPTTARVPVVGGGSTPVIAAPTARSTGPAPVIVIPTGDAPPTGDARQLQDKLSSAEAQLRESQANLARQSTELATRRAEAAATRIELDRVKAQLAAARATPPASAPASVPPGADAGILERERTAHAATQASLADAKRQLADQTTARTALERELSTRTAVAERAVTVATDDVKKQTARANELSTRTDALTRELAQARADAETARQAVAAATTKAGTEATQYSRQLTALEEKLSAATRELTQTKSALTAATASAQSAATQAGATAQAEAKLAALVADLGTLERELVAARALAERNATAKATTETALTAANEKIAATSRELATLRQTMDASQRQAASSTDQKVAALQSELTETRAKLGAAEKAATDRGQDAAGLRAALATASAQPKIAPAELDAARREASDARQQLATLTQEVAALRPQAAAARDLETRVRQLEAEKTAAVNSSITASLPAADSTASKEELARVTAARADAEGKLATALRSYSLMARERDELRARVAELSARTVAVAEPSPAPVAPAASETVARAIPPVRAPEPVRTEPARVEPARVEPARVEPERPLTPAVAARPGASQPTRPTAPASRAPRSHTVATGDTLTGLSLRYYGTSARWPEILAANRDILPDERSLVSGLTLRIP